VKRIIVWLVSLALGLITTFVMFIPLAIPFIRGGAFTIITILLMAFFFSLILDSILKARVYDETGLHFGPVSLGPVGRSDPKPPADYQPIVSREERRKQEQKQQTSNPPAARSH
jgi:hypothetical protein